MSNRRNLIIGKSSNYWGGNPYDRVRAEQIPEKTLQANFNKVNTLGLPFAVWREASSVLDNTYRCSCFKDTSKQPDIPCQSCYGTGTVPGYVKFGTRNYWSASIDGGWTLVNISLDTQNRPNRFMLSTGATTGTATSAVIPVSLTGKIGSWEYKAEAFTRDPVGGNSSITVEFAIDGSGTYHALSTINSFPPTTSIRFRITMTRVTATIRTPMFEIVRLRFPTLGDSFGILNEPVIRVIPTWDKNAEWREKYGDKTETQNFRFWTVPLTLFDSSIAANTISARLSEDVFVEQRYGAEVGLRFAVIDLAYSETFHVFSRQDFGLRRIITTIGSTQGEQVARIF